MKLIEREKDGLILVPETLNDLWYLYTHVEGREIWQKTLRTKTVCKGGEMIKGGKAPCFLGVLAEKLRWEDDKIRITGKIVEGNDRGKHHSMYFEMNEKTKIVGELENLPKAEKREIFVCVADRSGAILGILKGRNIEAKEEIEAKGRTKEFYNEAATKLKKMNPQYLLIAGPDAAKNKIAGLLEKKDNLFIDQIASGGKSGLEEVIKRSIVKQIFDLQREDAEKKTISETLACVKKNPEKALYGESLSKEMDRVREVLVLNNFVTKHENLLRQLDKNGSKINIIDGSKDYTRELRKFEIIGVCYW